MQTQTEMPSVTALETATGGRFTPSESEVFLSRREAATYLRCSSNTLAQYAMRNEGPPFRIVIGRALYPLSGLRRYAGVRLANAA